MPLTLAIIKALLFRVSERLYAVPLGNVLEILRSRESEVHVVDGQEVLQIREEVVPLIRLSRMHARLECKLKLFVIVVSLGDRKVGLVVDRLIGEQELVIKALDESLISSQLVSGASILGDGRVVLILSISDVVEKLGGGYNRSHVDAEKIEGAPVTPNNPMIRVLVVDDSALMRKLIPQLLERDNSIHVVGTAMDGAFALKKIEELKPDAITLDLEMPRMDGIETLRQIMRQQQIPVVVVSAHTREGASTTFKALHMGAFDFVAKPENVLADRMNEIAAELIAKIKAAVKSPFLRRPMLSSGLVRAQAQAPEHSWSRLQGDCPWRLHRWSAFGGVHAQPPSRRFSRGHPGGAAYARGIHRDLRAALERNLQPGGQGGAIGRPALPRTCANLPR